MHANPLIVILLVSSLIASYNNLILIPRAISLRGGRLIKVNTAEQRGHFKTGKMIREKSGGGGEDDALEDGLANSHMQLLAPGFLYRLIRNSAK